MRRITKVATIAATALTALIATGGAASASVDVTDGVGWVGKGDVQNALGGLNNSAIQTLVDTDGVHFTYTVTDTYLVTEEWWTGPDRNRKEHEETTTTTYEVDADVMYDARKVKGQKQWTGFNLSGFEDDSIVTGGDIPKVGDVTVVDPQNPGTNSDHVIVEVSKVASTGGLFVNNVPLPNTPDPAV